MDRPPHVPESLLARIRADPVHAPELIALAAGERHGPAARAWLAEQPARLSARHRARVAKRRHARYARLTGAVTGLGGALTIAPDAAAAIWIQSRAVFFIAAAFGFDPEDPMRPAELLTLYDLYDDPAAAREALDGAGRTLAEAMARRAMTSRDEDTLVYRLSTMLLKRGATRFAGRAVPGFAMVVNSVGNERAVRELSDRAIEFYGG